MKITLANKEEVCVISDLVHGEVFVYNDSVYMKTTEFSKDGANAKVVAIDLRLGSPAHFDDSYDIIRKPNAEVIVK